MTKPGVVTGGLVGLLLTAPLIVISALANQLAGLPFAPFDLFPFIRDLTPGAIMTFTIDTMVGAIRALNLGRVDTGAKTAEQAMAMGMLLGAGIAAGAIFFALLRANKSSGGFLPGLFLGLVAGAPMTLITLDRGLSATTSDSVSAVWTLLLFIVWGWLLGWVYQQLAGVEERSAVTTPARRNAKA